MKTIHEIIQELNQENGSNYKMQVLKKYDSNKLLKKVLKMTYDKVVYTYGITMSNINYIPESMRDITLYLSDTLEYLDVFLCTREVTGNEANQALTNLLSKLNKEDADVLSKIINRDLRINMGRSNINKVFKGLITKPIYMRCDKYTHDTIDKITNKKKKGTFRNINFKNGAYIQKKADGTYREFTVNSDVKVQSRSGEEYIYPALQEHMKTFPVGVYHGEITVMLTEDLLKKIITSLIKSDKKNGTTDADEIQTRFETEGDFILPRGIGNGLVNSDDVPYENLVLDLWDYVTPEDYSCAGLKDKKNLPTIKYKDRFKVLQETVEACTSEQIQVIEHYEVFSLKDALIHVSRWLEAGFEGGVLKDKEMLFKDGTSKQQLKLKLEIEADVRITGFTPGTGKNEAYFGAVVFENDARDIQGKVGVSSMTEELRDWFHLNRNKLIGKIMEVQFNDLSKGRGHDYYAFSHPRFIELRPDKDVPDTLEEVLRAKESAMNVKEDAC